MKEKDRKALDASAFFGMTEDVSELKGNAIETLRTVLEREVDIRWDGKTPLSSVVLEKAMDDAFNQRAMCELDLIDKLTAAPLRIVRYAEAFPHKLPMLTVEEAKAKLASVFERFMPRKPVEEPEESLA